MKKTLLLRAFFLFVLLSAAAPSWAQPSVLSPPQCGDWVKERKIGKSNSWQYEAWLAGYLSGLAVGNNTEFWKRGGNPLSPESVFLWMDNYCSANPLKRVDTGGFNLFLENIRTRKK